ncbi:glycosyltransferase family 2 protein [Lacihabitans sp. CCS-44]|uniref:glycosyltransferase family 2 protein n=1 Tax=Lacihabitans sp. CCS-44 TaxID=2487331 RepID=UPI0020CE393D|nr:glycosyltransferase family 2 protein [Lacihabitans sp. CCS-44]MCP9757528.1 glycosyltransferase family 2 protein [Lacihabitans sp. CCS-44]
MDILSVVIVNYKSWSILRKNLDLLASYHFENIELEVVVVDNFSDDKVLSVFKLDYPRFKIIENSGNWGFAHGCNLGVKHTHGNILLFLNPDTLAPQESLERMFWEYKANPEIGILTCKQSEKASSYQKISPSIFTLFGPQRSLYKLLNSSKFKESNCQTCNAKVVFPDWISGSVVMISRAWFDRVGGWNTDYWMYSEDVELSKKVKDAGGLLALLCNVNIVHEHGGASRINLETSALTKTEVIISQHVYIQNNFSEIQKVPSHILLVINTLFFKVILGAFGLVLFFLPKAKVQTLILKNCLRYYFLALKNQTWLSPKSYNFRER